MSHASLSDSPSSIHPFDTTPTHKFNDASATDNIGGALHRASDASKQYVAGLVGIAMRKADQGVRELKVRAAAVVLIWLFALVAYVYLISSLVRALEIVVYPWAAALIAAGLNAGAAYLAYRRLVAKVSVATQVNASPETEERVRTLQTQIAPQLSGKLAVRAASANVGVDGIAGVAGDSFDEQLMDEAKFELNEASRDLKEAASNSVSPRHHIQRRPLPILAGGFVVGALIGLALPSSASSSTLASRALKNAGKRKQFKLLF